MSKLKSIIYLTQSDYTTLSNGGTVTKNGHTLTGIDEDCIYITTDQASVEDLTGILPVSHGGTGKNTLLSGQVLIGNGTGAITSKAIASTITNNSNTLPSTAAVYNDALLKSGGTMTGVLTVLGNQYADGYNGALNMNNSDIYGLNSIYTADSADNAGEGIHFYRDSTHVDTLWINGGDILFAPNRALGTATTKANSEKVARLPASITASRAVYTDGTTGELAISSVTATELGYLNGVTSSIQTQLNNKAASNAKITIAGNDVGLGGSLTAATLTSSLGLSNALHFIGITSTALENSSTTATLTPKTANPSSLTKTTGFVDGDVVMDGDQLREYVWSGGAWRLLGITTSTAYKQPASTATNTWIAQVSQGTDGKITATTGSLNTSGTWSGKANTAGTADKISNLVTADQASSSATWRRVWISYNDNVNGRPAYTDNFAYQTSTNTLKTPHLLTEHVSGGSAEIQIKYGTTIDYWWGVGTSNENHGLYDNKAAEWILYAGAANTWTFVGNVTGNVSGSAGSVAWTNVSGRPTNLNQFTNGPGYVTSSGVTSVAAGVGLTGGTITGTGTIKAKLKSETAHTADSASLTNTANRQYAIGIDKSGYLSVNVPWTDTDTDTKNTAGSTNFDSKLYLIGATSQTANSQTYSDAHVFETNGAFSAKTLGVNADTDSNKVTLQWNSTDSSLDFVFA